MIKTIALLAFFVFAFGIALAECNTAGDCKFGGICVQGSCSECSPDASGQKCSDDNVHGFGADGVCTYEGRCEESVVCQSSLSGKLLSSCLSCQNTDICDTNASGGFSPGGICMGGKCQTELCVSLDGKYPKVCGSEDFACAENNEGKACDSVGDGNFFPGDKICYNGKCLGGNDAANDSNTSVRVEPSFSKPTAPKNDGATERLGLFGLLFGPISGNSAGFLSIVALSALFSILAFPRIRAQFSEDRKTTREKQYHFFRAFFFTLLIFLLPFQLAKAFEYQSVLLLLAVSVISLSMFNFYEAKFSNERKAVKVQ